MDARLAVVLLLAFACLAGWGWTLRILHEAYDALKARDAALAVKNELILNAADRQDLILRLLAEKQRDIEHLHVTAGVLNYWHGCEREPAQG